MGLFFSSFCKSFGPIPPLPSVIKPDPPFNVTINCVIKKIAPLVDYFSVHEIGQSNMWLWMRKIELARNVFSIDLENFHRGVNGDCSRGNVLYNVMFPIKQQLDFYSRMLLPAHESFQGEITKSLTIKDDIYYANHITHCKKIAQTNLNRDMITKWNFSTQALFCDGDCHRYVNFLKGESIHLQIHASGTIVTSWTHENSSQEYNKRDIDVVEQSATNYDINKQSINEKLETNFVDHIEFRVVCHNEVWDSWSWSEFKNHKDSLKASSDEYIKTPFFHTTIKGGWYQPREYEITTSRGIDPALSILLSHVCMTEFSIEKIRTFVQSNITTPEELPSTGSSLHKKVKSNNSI